MLPLCTSNAHSTFLTNDSSFVLVCTIHCHFVTFFFTKNKNIYIFLKTITTCLSVDSKHSYECFVYLAVKRSPEHQIHYWVWI